MADPLLADRPDLADAADLPAHVRIGSWLERLIVSRTLRAGDAGELLQNPAIIWQELACPLKVTQRRVVILQAIVVVFALCEDGLTEIGLKGAGGFRCVPDLLHQLQLERLPRRRGEFKKHVI